ncbi:MAG: DNA recombination protein RmuC [bacterium]
MPIVIALVSVGLVAGFFLGVLFTRSGKVDAAPLIDQLKDSFDALSYKSLSRNSEEFLKLARENYQKESREGAKELEGKKLLIDQSLAGMKEELDKVNRLVSALEKDREKKFGALDSQLKQTALQTGRLQETTADLREALANTRVRGQWGERMAEDVLRLAGFIDGVNYCKQKTMESSGTRPDFTFLLPQDLVINMDVKFPLENYLNYLETKQEKEGYKQKFLRDVRSRIKEVTSRSYINPEEKTLDFVILFIPNEQVFSFIQEHDPSLLDAALQKKAILCSPLTLYAILAVIRQAVDNFHLERTGAEILSLLGAFYKQWEAFNDSLDKMGKKIDDARDEFVRLTTTRSRQLERPLAKIETLRKQKGISEARITGPDNPLSPNKK